MLTTLFQLNKKVLYDKIQTSLKENSITSTKRSGCLASRQVVNYGTLNGKWTEFIQRLSIHSFTLTLQQALDVILLQTRGLEDMSGKL